MDRNLGDDPEINVCYRSLSARRAWIEMPDHRGKAPFVAVALRKESVDRNVTVSLYSSCALVSLSARRAWIEICARLCTYIQRYVALRKESVDRNKDTLIQVLFDKMSLSARRAWIEIFRPSPQVKPVRGVALRKESVDRNACLLYTSPSPRD